jgi:hypothetical protein
VNPLAKHPRDLQDDSQKDFPNKVAGSNLKLFEPGRPIVDDAAILIGVASYSGLDLELLDKVDQSVPQWSDRFKIYVFDIASFNSLEDLQACLFGDRFWHLSPEPKRWPPVRQTPIVLVSMAHQAIEFRQGVGPCEQLLADLNVL